MKKINLREIEYELVENYKDAFFLEDVQEKITDYFDSFDFILGDYSYDKLRLKGFCIKGNKLFKEINDFNNVQNYLKKFCSYDCRYFILKKITKNDKNS